jgi:four helix bundle protein
MATIQGFEELECWQSARDLCKKIYHFTYKDKFSKDFAIKNQIRESSGSVMDNIAEGYNRGGNKEFNQFLSIARGSLGEVISQLYRSSDQNYITNEEFEVVMELSDKTVRKISGLMNYLKGSNLKGYKYH